MHKAFWILLGLSVLLLSFSSDLSFAQGENESSNVTVSNITNVSDVPVVNESQEKNLEIVLFKSRYLPNVTVDGIVKIRLGGPVDSDESVNVRFANYSYNVNMTEILRSMNTSYILAPPVIEAVNPSGAKSISVKSGKPSMFAVKLPKEIDKVVSMNMGIVGDASNKLTVPYMDIGNDGKIDWFYLGDFSSWNQKYINSSDLKEEGARTVIMYDNLQNRSLYYCAWIDVPRTKDIKIFAKYRKLADGGNITAAVLNSITPGDPLEISGFGTSCDLPEQNVMQYASCDIHLDYAAKNKLHVCVFTKVPGRSEDAELYSLGVDALEPASSTSFNCEPDEEWGVCLPHENGDYFVKVQTAKYESNLNKVIGFNDWNTYPNSFVSEIEAYVGTSGAEGPVLEGVCSTSICTVPVSIYGNGTGEISLSNLDLKYKSEGSTTVESTFYEVERATTQIISVDGADLSATPVMLEVPLSVFGDFNTPFINTVFVDQSLKMKFGDDSDEAFFRVYKDKIPQSQTERLVDATGTVIANALTNEDMSKMLKVLQLDEKFTSAKEKLDEYSVLLVQQGEDPALVAEVEQFVADLPSSIRLKKSLVDKFVAEPSDVSKDIKSPLSAEEIYNFQFKADIIAQLKIYEIAYNSGDKTTALAVVKKIAPKSTIGKVNVFEFIPKSVAQSVDDIKFDQVPKIVNPDPVVSWYFPSLEQTEISYVIVSESEPSIYEFKTLIAPSGEEKEEAVEEEPVCGDGVCDATEDDGSCAEDCKVEAKVNVLNMVLIAVGLVLVLMYALAFLNPNSFRKAALGGMPFKRKEHLESLTAYISGAKSKGVADSKIMASLKQSKWSDKQINFAFKALVVDRQLDAQLKSIPAKQKSAKPMNQYMSAALARGWNVEMVKGYLLKAGWSKGEISSAYLSARLGVPLRLAFSKIGIRVK